MNFDQEIGQILNGTLTIMAGIERRHAEARTTQAEGMAVHEKRMNHIDGRLPEITNKLEGRIGFMDGHFRQPPN